MASVSNPCAVDCCSRRVVGRGFCALHRTRFMKYGDANIQRPSGQPAKSPMENFSKHVTRGSSEECWEWVGYVDPNGYGVFHIGEVRVGAHRAAHMFFNGPIAEGLHVLHSCDNRRCVNPAHLRAGTHRENMLEAMDKNRDAHADSGGTAKLTSEMVLEMRERRRNGETVTSLASAYGVAIGTASRAINGVNWRRLKLTKGEN